MNTDHSDLPWDVYLLISLLRVSRCLIHNSSTANGRKCFVQLQILHTKSSRDEFCPMSILRHTYSWGTGGKVSRQAICVYSGAYQCGQQFSISSQYSYALFIKWNFLLGYLSIKCGTNSHEFYNPDYPVNSKPYSPSCKVLLQFF